MLTAETSSLLSSQAFLCALCSRGVFARSQSVLVSRRSETGVELDVNFYRLFMKLRIECEGERYRAAISFLGYLQHVFS